MIVTNKGMHVREVVSIDKVARTVTVRGFGHPAARAIDHVLNLSELKADAGVAEIENKLTAFLLKQEK